MQRQLQPCHGPAFNQFLQELVRRRTRRGRCTAAFGSTLLLSITLITNKETPGGRGNPTLAQRLMQLPPLHQIDRVKQQVC